METEQGMATMFTHCTHIGLVTILAMLWNIWIIQTQSISEQMSKKIHYESFQFVQKPHQFINFQMSFHHTYQYILVIKYIKS
jgi:hypothetical protein